MSRFILFITRLFFKVLFGVILILFLVIAIEYIICPVYIFPEYKAFKGDKIYNPYHEIDSNYWNKANFQVQSYAWLGITDGRENSNEEIDSIYRILHYDIIAISDYQKINKYGAASLRYVPVYEHGYGIYKNHQVNIGADKVLWTDYPFFQTIHNKQHILNLLKKRSELVYIAHPKMRSAYSLDDMKYLSNYTGLEVLNNFGISMYHWDAALSAGKPVTILGNDDAHNVMDPDEVGFRCTYVFSKSIEGDSIIKALHGGTAFAAEIYRPDGESFSTKIKRSINIPKLNSAEIEGDTLKIIVNTIAQQFRFVGQDGEVKKVIDQTDKAYYIIQENDTYIRTEITFPDRTTFYLNPVFRFEGNDPWYMETPEVNIYKTWLLRIIGFASLLFIIFNIIFIIKLIRRKKRVNG